MVEHGNAIQGTSSWELASANNKVIVASDLPLMRLWTVCGVYLSSAYARRVLAMTSTMYN